MKKEDASGLIIFILLIGIAVVFGLTVLRNYSMVSGMELYQYVLYILGALVTGLIFNSLILELAHMIGAKIGRYDIKSVNVFHFNFYKDQSKWKFKFANFDGLTGETKIYPKSDAKKEPNPKPYLLFPTLFLAIEILIAVILFNALNINHAPSSSEVRFAYFFLIVGVIGAMILFYNIVPFKLDSMTDGYRLTTVSNSKNKEAFNELLKVEQDIADGKDNVEIKTFTTITEYTANLNLNKVYLLLDKKEFKEAEKIIDIIIDGKVNLSNKTFIRARAQKIYINLVTKTLDEAACYYEQYIPIEERKLISEDTSMPCIRTYLLMAGLLDRSRSECVRTLNRVYKAYKQTPKMRRHVELILFNEALDMVHNAHPKWELIDYKLNEEESTKKN